MERKTASFWNQQINIKKINVSDVEGVKAAKQDQVILGDKNTKEGVPTAKSLAQISPSVPLSAE